MRAGRPDEFVDVWAEGTCCPASRDLANRGGLADASNAFGGTEARYMRARLCLGIFALWDDVLERQFESGSAGELDVAVEIGNLNRPQRNVDKIQMRLE